MLVKCGPPDQSGHAANLNNYRAITAYNTREPRRGFLGFRPAGLEPDDSGICRSWPHLFFRPHRLHRKARRQLVGRRLVLVYLVGLPGWFTWLVYLGGALSVSSIVSGAQSSSHAPSASAGPLTHRYTDRMPRVRKTSKTRPPKPQTSR